MSKRSELEVLRRNLEQKQRDLDVDYDSVVAALDDLDDEPEAPAAPGMSDKATEQRYARASVNWGVIAVHPTDLYNVYKNLSTRRVSFIQVNKGQFDSRTTAVAFLIAARAALVRNGYTSAEAAVIAASVIANGT